jgi:hypothetical protein
LIVVCIDAWVAPARRRWQFHPPSAICSVQVVHDALDARVVGRERHRDRQQHAGQTCLALPDDDREVGAAVGGHTTIEEQDGTV